LLECGRPGPPAPAARIASRRGTRETALDETRPPAALRIGSGLYDRVLAHLLAAAPLEAVGLLAVADDARGDAHATRFYPGTNVDASPTRYTMHPAAVLAALRDIEAHGWRLGAIVHSHPATPPVPSATDLREAQYPDALVIIVGLANTAAETRAWRLPVDTNCVGAVVEVPILVDRDGPVPDRLEGGRTTRSASAVRRQHAAHHGIGANDAAGGLIAGGDQPLGRGRAGDRPVTSQLPPPDALLTALAATPDEVARALDGQPDEALVRPASDGGWGVVENLAHIRDWEEIFLERARVIVEQNRPHLPAYDDELWAIERDYRSQSPWPIVEQFRELRSRLVALLEGLPAEAWDRVADHSAYGEITLQWMIDHIADHDQEHLAQLREALA